MKILESKVDKPISRVDPVSATPTLTQATHKTKEEQPTGAPPGNDRASEVHSTDKSTLSDFKSLIEKELNPDRLMQILKILQERIIVVNKELPTKETKEVKPEPATQPREQVTKEPFTNTVRIFLSEMEKSTKTENLKEILEELVSLLEGSGFSKSGSPDDRARKDTEAAFNRIKNTKVRPRAIREAEQAKWK